MKSDLFWLPTLTEKKRRRLLTLVNETDLNLYELISFTQYQLNNRELDVLVEAFGLVSQGRGIFSSHRLLIVSNSSIKPFFKVLQGSAFRHYLNLEIEFFEVERVEELAKIEDQYLSQFEVVVVAFDFRIFEQPAYCFTTKVTTYDSEAYAQYVFNLKERTTSLSNCRFAVQTIPQPLISQAANERKRTQSIYQAVRRLNSLLYTSEINVFDVEYIANRVVLKDWHDLVMGNFARIPLSVSCMPVYGDRLAHYVACLFGRTKKAIIVDLDNTVWGGAIGEQGLNGIKLGMDSTLGRIYSCFQEYLVELNQRGTLICVCSKNEYAQAIEALRCHPEQILREQHIVSLKINWDDKASNIQQISRELNLGLDSFVFIDDEPFERENVRQALPMVSVPEVPSNDPIYYKLVISAAGYFDGLSNSEYAQNRTKLYQDEALRRGEMSAQIDYPTFLRSLEMKIEYSSFLPVFSDRIVELISRSNQFNLTTVRYSLEEVKFMEMHPDFHCFAFRLEDRIGDCGLISVIVCHESDKVWLIKLWVMSCRVIGRDVERACLRILIGEAQKKGIKELIGIYRETPKNTIVKGHYRSLGFAYQRGTEEECSWTLSVCNYSFLEVLPFTIKKREAE